MVLVLAKGHFVPVLPLARMCSHTRTHTHTLSLDLSPSLLTSLSLPFFFFLLLPLTSWLLDSATMGEGRAVHRYEIDAGHPPSHPYTPAWTRDPAVQQMYAQHKQSPNDTAPAKSSRGSNGGKAAGRKDGALPAKRAKVSSKRSVRR